MRKQRQHTARLAWEDVAAIENLQVGLGNLDSQGHQDSGERVVAFTCSPPGMHGEFLPKYDWPVHRFQNMVRHSFRGDIQAEAFAVCTVAGRY